MTCTEPDHDLVTHVLKVQNHYMSLRDRMDALETVSKDTNDRLKITDHKVDQVVMFTNTLTSRLDDHDRRFETIRAKLIEHDRRFEAIDEKLKVHDRRFEAIDRKLAEHDKRFDAIDQRFVAIDERFEAIDQKFEAVDKRFDAMDQKIDQGFAELKDLLADALSRKN